MKNYIREFFFVALYSYKLRPVDKSLIFQSGNHALWIFSGVSCRPWRHAPGPHDVREASNEGIKDPFRFFRLDWLRSQIIPQTIHAPRLLRYQTVIHIRLFLGDLSVIGGKCLLCSYRILSRLPELEARGMFCLRSPRIVASVTFLIRTPTPSWHGLG